MMNLMLIMCMAVLQGSSFRIGGTFDASWPAMGDEKDYADLLEEGGLDYQLDGMCWTGGLEALGDVSDKLRLRGGITVSRFHGTYEEIDEFGYTIAGILTGGLLFLLDPGGEDVVAMEDVSTNIEVAGYYKLTDGPTISIGGGPALLMVSRKMDTPNTNMSESATGMGFNAAVRLDGESGNFLGLPIVLGLEGGYRFRGATFDTDYSDDFSVDFSGPYLKVGTYLKI